MPPSKRQQPAPAGAADAPAGRDPDFAPDDPIPDEPAPDVEPAVDVEPVETLAEPEAVEALPFMSAGVASDLAMRGWAGDPATGGTFRRDPETGTVTFTPRGDDKTVAARDVPGLV